MDTNPMTSKQINDIIFNLKLEFYAKTKPLFPEHAVPKRTYKTATANGLTRAIMDSGKYLGAHMVRMSNEGRYRPGAVIKTPAGTRRGPGVWLPGTANGISDILMTFGGQTYFIEIKIKDKQLPSQKKFETNLQAAGGNYIIIRTFAEFLDLIDTILNRSSLKLK